MSVCRNPAALAVGRRNRRRIFARQRPQHAGQRAALGEDQRRFAGPWVEADRVQVRFDAVGDRSETREVVERARLVGNPRPWNLAALAQVGQGVAQILVRPARAGRVLWDDPFGDAFVKQEFA